jgi:hypothetical protein
MGFFFARRLYGSRETTRSVAMVSNPDQVILIPEEHDGLFIHVTSAHHRDFPEVHAEASSPEAATTRLAELLALSLDNAPSDWSRQYLEQALEDVRAFAARQH